MSFLRTRQLLCRRKKGYYRKDSGYSEANFDTDFLLMHTVTPPLF